LEFLNKRPAAEVFLNMGGKLILITKRGDYADKIRYCLRYPKEVIA
jgi:hypothetical protein